ncbi:MAG TPA: UDP-galactopyranose mutase [Armatimonadota bacterium]
MVGAGLFGSTHVFHTASERVWRYVNPLTDLNHFSLRVKVRHGDRLNPFPINLLTLNRLWGVATPEKAEERLGAVRETYPLPRNLEGWSLSQAGSGIYRTSIEGYTREQWGRSPSELPASISRRIPIRLTMNDRYYPDLDRWEGVPSLGYTPTLEELLAGVNVQLGVDFPSERDELGAMANRVVFTGPIDAYFGYRHGALDYRSLRFQPRLRGGQRRGPHLHQ